MGIKRYTTQPYNTYIYHQRSGAESFDTSKFAEHKDS